MEFILMLLLCEPSVLYYPVLDSPPQHMRASVPWGAGLRARITGGTWEHAVRVRFDIASRRFDYPVGDSQQNVYYTFALDYLHHGGGWGSRWYYGAGFGWMERSYDTQSEGADGTVVTNVVTGNTATGSLILGRALDVGKGQFMLEGRVDAASLDGEFRPTVTLSVGYRHHFTNK
jgi:hypothetical protein